MLVYAIRVSGIIETGYIVLRSVIHHAKVFFSDHRRKDIANVLPARAVRLPFNHSVLSLKKKQF